MNEGVGHSSRKRINKTAEVLAEDRRNTEWVVRKIAISTS